MKKLLTLIAMVTAVLTVAAGTVRAEATAHGDFEFSLDTASFRIDDGMSLQEVYIRVANPHLRFKENDGKLETLLRLSIQIKDDDGNRVAKQSEDVKVHVEDQAQARNPLQFVTIIKRFKLTPGQYSLSVALEDRYAPKITVVGMAKGDHKTATVSKFPLEVSAYPVETITLSDAKFLWELERTDDKLIQHPNPSRMYGLHRDSLQVYVEAYVTPEVANAAPLEMDLLILDENGETMVESSVPLPRITGADKLLTVPLVIREDLNRVPAGSYTLYLNAGQGAQLLARVRCGKFSVAWDMRTWEISRRDLLAEARFLLDPKEFQGFASRPIGEQEQILNAMWKEVDPDPTTGVNESYEIFVERLNYVNAKYSDYQTGFYTDRGLIYLKYGPPDEFIQEVVPVNRGALSDAMEKVYDRFHTVDFSNSGGRQGYKRPARNIVVDPRRISQVGEGGEVAPAFELWVYNERGKPLLEKHMSLDAEIGMRFFFVDRDGYGRYMLESSSSMNQK